MTESEKKQLLEDVLKSLFGPQLKGKYLVEFRGSTVIDADTHSDARKKAFEAIKEDPRKVTLMVTRVEDLIDND